MKGFGTDKAVFDCPHCRVNGCLHTWVWHEAKAYVSHELITAGDGKQEWKTREYRHYIYRCAQCEKDTYFLAEHSPREIEASPHSQTPPRVRRKEATRIVHQFPLSSPALHEALPDDVSAAAEEAEKCLAIGAPSACGTMTRRAVDALAQDKGAVGKDTYARLLDLKNKQIIAPDIWDSAEELRTAGKLGAHPEWEDLTLEEARFVVHLMREILRYVYINPYEREARRLKGVKGKKP